MKITSLLQFLCLAYALLLRFAQSVPVYTNLGDSAPFDDSNGFSSVDKTQEYMMTLYNRFENNKFELPAANIVRSFKNIHMKDEDQNKIIHDNGLRAGYKSHILTFNITSITQQETVSLAELRIFKLIKHGKDSSAFSVERTISVLDIVNAEIDGTIISPEYILVQSRHVHSQYSDWETLNITSAVESWLKSGKSIHKLEVRIEPLKFWPWYSYGFMDLETTPNDSKEPSLLVYSNEKSTKRRRWHASERQELMSRDLLSHSVSSSVKTRTKRSYISAMVRGVMKHNSSKRKLRRKVINGTSCRRRRMYVNFQDINWSWVIAPKGYQAYQCVGRCLYPVHQRRFTSNHAIIQSLQHSRYSSKNSKEQNREERRFAKRPCCVPTKLKPISMLYRDQQGVLTYKYRYDGMVVERCGCR